MSENKNSAKDLVKDFEKMLGSEPPSNALISDMFATTLSAYNVLHKTAQSLSEHHFKSPLIHMDNPFLGFCITTDKKINIMFWSQGIEIDLSGKYIVRQSETGTSGILSLESLANQKSERVQVKVIDEETNKLIADCLFGYQIQTYRGSFRELSKADSLSEIAKIEMEADPAIKYLTQTVLVKHFGKRLGINPSFAHKSLIKLNEDILLRIHLEWKTESNNAKQHPSLSLTHKLKKLPLMTQNEVDTLLDIPKK